MNALHSISLEVTTFKQHFIIVPDVWDLLRKREYSHGFMLNPGGGDGKLNSVKMYLMFVFEYMEIEVL